MTPVARLDRGRCAGRRTRPGELLTNNGPLVGEHLATLAPELVPLFGDHLRSSYYGARKPNRVVFQRLLDEYDADPADVFFTDDLIENVRGAESVGITGPTVSSTGPRSWMRWRRSPRRERGPG